MRSGTIACLLGICFMQQLALLPRLPWGLLLFAILILIALVPGLRLVLLFTAGIVWAGLAAQSQLSQYPADHMLDQVLTVEGRISGIPAHAARRTKFDFEVARLDHGEGWVRTHGVWRLSWFGEVPTLRSGDRWRIAVSLNEPRSFLSTGAFDYERYLLHNGVRAVGNVHQNPRPVQLESADQIPTIDRVRQVLSERIQENSELADFSGIIAALTVGVRQGVKEAQWKLLRRTGTAHLMAISGLHIGLVAVLAAFIGRTVWAGTPLIRMRWPAIKLSALSAMAAATGYAAMAGFSIPTRRALVMVVVFMGAAFLLRKVSPSRALATALLATLLVDPLAPLQPGFWLSFMAVAAILLVIVGRIGVSEPLSVWCRVQIALTVALMPMVIVAFGQVSLVSLPANLVAVPWVSVTVVPWALLGVVLELVGPGLGAWALLLAEQALQALWSFLLWLDGLDLVQTMPEPRPTAIWAAALGGLLWLAPRGLPGRWLGPALMLLMLMPAHELARDQIQVALLDTQGGMSCVVRTQSSTMVYDTGPRYGFKFDAGQAVLVPFLRALGVEQVDSLVISRMLPDRTGGIRSLRLAMPVLSTVVPNPSLAPIPDARACTPGDSWHRDGVLFRVFAQASANESSDACSVLIETPKFLVLLAGGGVMPTHSDLHRLGADSSKPLLLVTTDIEVRTQRRGIDSLHPTMVLVSGAVDSWLSAHSVLATEHLGMLSVVLGNDGFGPLVSGWNEQRRYWHRPRGP